MSRDRESRTSVSWLGILLAAAVAGAPGPGAAQERLAVVATLPTYAAIAREITGDLAEVGSIARGDEDPHFVNPRPSFVRMIQEADLFITTGLDLELWVPSLIDRANNRRVLEGRPGHVTAYSGIELLDVPASVSRAGGDVHVFGSPHVHTDPINAILIGRNILAGLRRVDAENATAYESNAASFEDRILRRLFGDDLVEMLGGETLFRLAVSRQFWSFVEGREFQGRPLGDFVGGWLGQAAGLRGRRIACYHKNWAYLSARLQIDCAIYIEPKPGIPASPGHVQEVIAFIRSDSIPILFAANYFSRRQIEQVASRGGATPVVVPEHVEGEESVVSYFDLVDIWITRLVAAIEEAP